MEKVKCFFIVALIAAVFMTVSCRQIGGMIAFRDDEWTRMREDASACAFLAVYMGVK